LLVIVKSARLIPKITVPIIRGTNWTIEVLDGIRVMPIQETPNIRAILDILDPITVPIANASLPLRTEDIPTKISGADVPNATIVNPIVSSLNPSFLATRDELSTNLSAPHTRTARDITKLDSEKIITHSTLLDRVYI
jgi:hypothetical protein